MNQVLPSIQDLLSFDSESFAESSLESHLAGLVAVGPKFTFENLVRAYSNGIFPWPHQDHEYLWFSPLQRGIIDFSGIHLSKSFKKVLRKSSYVYTIDSQFEEVISKCQSIFRKGQTGTWITEDLKVAMIGMYKRGFAHSLEAWSDGVLVGGIYWVETKNTISAESMFGTRSHVSKLCLYELIQRLQKRGFHFLDIQMITPVTKQFGGHTMDRSDFLRRL